MRFKGQKYCSSAVKLLWKIYSTKKKYNKIKWEF